MRWSYEMPVTYVERSDPDWQKKEKRANQNSQIISKKIIDVECTIGNKKLGCFGEAGKCDTGKQPFYSMWEVVAEGGFPCQSREEHPDDENGEMDEVIEAQGEDESIVEVCLLRIEGNEGSCNYYQGVEQVGEGESFLGGHG